MLNWVRGKVSLNKRRLQEGDYDLDLSYVGDSIIAMGYPASGFESLYRNDFSVVRRFLNERHGDKYWVYNLCSERSYDKSAFDGRVNCYPFEDHNPPKFDMIRQFCNHAKEFLDKDPLNIVVVHCKAGKGRTGVMIGALLVHIRRFPHASEALQFYGRKRTHDNKGVTIPSQRRYVFYYEQFLQLGLPLQDPFVASPARVTKVVFKNVPKKFFTRSLHIIFKSIPGDPKVEINSNDLKIVPDKDHEHKTLTFDFGDKLPMYSGDFRIAAVKGGTNIWYMWFNSQFILPEEEFTKPDIDKIFKDKTFPDDFIMAVYSTK
ncbi:phosphatidylinositol-3,4,5-trisphosphate 3-phosphatase, putative [Trichomonas vaginalis G3]|uniref:Phosphatidylinositol 3,4,5-trisphosphate 3-phosphatase and dual-specificity protein phosphatase PTEN n=1 Tax=Trichomonas vaginalis (strain ATCC PRA-98 / G3) TaxID=412133 RepID=A2DUZ6_TRIV3|nr:phosphatidylinositol-3,4,5-trisphosphate 3-phosphatase protein [Trichomonas vaginalis G3]EAY15723.1 phosphatidylinositol-3,4,5-trisphosphate 3-phosphatase, putative [Trichomonas vaginalis G3]KAI5486470.1 phosphatidylinositol-3,4,5-trisphosphate 3-phosphatase protein [Trichomonas vaginalis G3]|eukprot:XP_001327946.1 phosphatidylinositol-3,4,5-trisphosphate 3-phosphatase [Trichomonas vaginalis G3]